MKISESHCNPILFLRKSDDGRPAVKVLWDVIIRKWICLILQNGEWIDKGRWDDSDLAILWAMNFRKGTRTDFILEFRQNESDK